MNWFRILAVFCLALLLVSGAHGIRTVVSDGRTVITEPIDDDVFASGDTIVFDAPIGSLMAAGGAVHVNGPVAGDVVAAGGRISINGTVGGKVVLAGGRVEVNGMVQRNAIVTAGETVFGPGAKIGRDAEVSGGSFTHQGAVNGTLGVQAGTFENSGTAGKIRYDTAPGRARGPGATNGLEGLVAILAGVVSLLVAIGYLILGLLLLALAPATARAVEERVRERALPAFVIGLVALVVAVILGMILLVTIVGIPIAVFTWLFVIAALMVAGLVVSLALGRLLAGGSRYGENVYVLFILGFVILNVLYLVPFLGGLAKFVVVCLGFGAIVMAAMDAFSNRRAEAL